MSDTPTNVKYLAEFIDGPLAGTTETRVLVDGEYDDEVSSLASMEGAESLFWYIAGDTREVEGELHVQYRFDRRDSDPIDGDDPNDQESLNL